MLRARVLRTTPGQGKEGRGAGEPLYAVIWQCPLDPVLGVPQRRILCYAHPKAVAGEEGRKVSAPLPLLQHFAPLGGERSVSLDCKMHNASALCFGAAGCWW